MEELQSRLINLEGIVKELNVLYKYCYTEQDLIELDKSLYCIESIDETKNDIESMLFSLIIDAVIEGAKPQDKTVYNIISAFSDVLNLKEVVGVKKFNKFQRVINMYFLDTIFKKVVKV